MDFEKYSERVRGFLQSAQTNALAQGHQQFAPEHVLKVLLDDEEGLAAGLLKTSVPVVAVAWVWPSTKPVTVPVIR